MEALESQSRIHPALKNIAYASRLSTEIKKWILNAINICKDWKIIKELLRLDDIQIDNAVLKTTLVSSIIWLNREPIEFLLD